MKNTIMLTIPFSFKGENHSPSSRIDLDIFCQQEQPLEALCHIVATENNIGNYSYEYEVLHASTLLFSDATGIAEYFLVENEFDLEGFRNGLREQQALIIFQKIVKNVLDIDNIEEHEPLISALQQAYDAGKDNCARENS